MRQFQKFVQYTEEHYSSFSREEICYNIAIKIPSVFVLTKLSHEHFGLMKFSLKAVRLIEPALSLPVLPNRRLCHDRLIPLSHGLQTEHDFFSMIPWLSYI